jgi:hypothetical protein
MAGALMFYLIDMCVKLTYSVILSFAAILGLFIMPPIGIVLFFYLRSYMKRQLYHNYA